MQYAKKHITKESIKLTIYNKQCQATTFFHCYPQAHTKPQQMVGKLHCNSQTIQGT